jgi:hypothetical protein
VHEVFNEQPDKIFLPFGSGRLDENFLTWQCRSLRNEMEGRRDPRLSSKVPISKVISMDIFAAEPEQQQRAADRLTAKFKPFLLFNDIDIHALVNLSFTGRKTGKYLVPEQIILEAQKIFDECGIHSEPSAAAGFGLYLLRFKAGQIRPEEKVLIINTGKGLV